MARGQLERMNELDEKIKEYESFIFLSSREGFWEKLFFERRFKLFTSVHGFYKGEKEGMRLDKDVTFKIIAVLEEEKEKMQKELQGMLSQSN